MAFFKKLKAELNSFSSKLTTKFAFLKKLNHQMPDNNIEPINNHNEGFKIENSSKYFNF